MSEARKPSTLIKLGARTLAGIVVLVLAAGIFTALYMTKPAPDASTIEETRRVVLTVTVNHADVARQWNSYGTAHAQDSADLSAQVSATVIERPANIEPGHHVRKGDLLIRLDDAEYRDRLEAAQRTIASIEAELSGLDVETESIQDQLTLSDESLELLRDELARWTRAADQGGVNTIERDRITRELKRLEQDREGLAQRLNLLPSRRLALEARIAAERANAHRAELDVQRCRILSPLDGVVQRVSVEQGELVSPGSPVARVVDLRRIEAPMKIGASAAPFVRIGDEVELCASGASTLCWPGRVVRIAPEADPATRTLTVYVEVTQDQPTDRPASLLPGQFVTGTLRSSRIERTVIVPRSAVSSERVVVVDADGRVSFKPVTIEHHIERLYPDLHPQETQWAVVSSGLDPGDVVVVSNLDDLTPGGLVEPQSILTATNSDDTRAPDGRTAQKAPAASNGRTAAP